MKAPNRHTRRAGGARARGAGRVDAAQLHVSPEIPQLLQQGMSLQMKGQLWQALDRYQEVLKRQPNQPDALHLMGIAALDTMRLDAALQLFRRAVAGKPADPVLRTNYAGALLLDNDPAAAERQLQRALKLSPDNLDALCKLARCKALTGRTAEARQIFSDVLDRNPDHPSALIDFADFEVGCGAFETAQALYRKAINKEISPAAALAGLARCKTFEGAPPELDEIRQRLSQSGITPGDHAALCHAASKIASDIGRHEEAFEYAAIANQQRGRTFDRDAHQARYDKLKALFTPEFFAARKGFGDPSEQPVFIVGMPRSGTTLTEQIIASHPQADGAGELRKMRSVAEGLGLKPGGDAEFARRLNALTRKEARTAARDYLSALRLHQADAARLADKLPHNFELLGLIALLLPNAKIVHCRRDPLDTCVSCFMTPLSEVAGYSSDLTAIGHYYRDYTALIAHWRKVLPVAIHDLDYERLVDDLPGEAHKLIDFIGLDWDPACLAFYETERMIHSESRVQVRAPIYRQAVGHWRRYERQIGPLRTALGDLAGA